MSLNITIHIAWGVLTSNGGKVFTILDCITKCNERINIFLKGISWVTGDLFELCWVIKNGVEFSMVVIFI